MFLELNKSWKFQKLTSLLNASDKTEEMEKSLLVQDKNAAEGVLPGKRKRTLNEDVINMLLNFVIKEVYIHL